MADYPVYDVLIVGSGAAGLSLALRLAQQSAVRIGVLSKFSLKECNSYYAQGGISAVVDRDDSLEAHISDTLEAGAGLCDPEIVTLTVSQGKECIDWLLDQGFPLPRKNPRTMRPLFILRRKAAIPTVALSMLQIKPGRPSVTPWRNRF